MVSQRGTKYPEKPCISYKNMQTGAWETETWGQMKDRVDALAKAYISLGLKPQDKIGIFAQNMREIVEADFAIHSAKMVAVPMYATSASEYIEYIVNDGKIEAIFVGEQYQFDQVAMFFGKNQYLKHVIAIDPKIDTKGIEGVIRFNDFIKLGQNDAKIDEELKTRRENLCDDDLAILIYTSGTTGEPKGVMLTYENAETAVRLNSERMPNVCEGVTSLAFLPFSHIFERGWFYLCMSQMVHVYVNQNPKEILQTLKEVHPNMMCAVPRFWEKVYDGVHEKIDSFPSLLRKLTYHSLEIGKEYNIGCRMVGKEASLLLRLRYKFYEKTLFNVLRKAIGIDKGTFFPCAGSQTSEKVNIFMHSVGINLVVGYGLTETFATVSCYPHDNRNYNLKTVGDILPDIEAKVGEDRELLLKGKTITKGYYNKPEANKNAFTEDGFFRTGDAVELLDGPNGTKQIVMIERIKELFKTSNGKYIAPQMLEMALEGDPYIEQSAVIADLRKYVTALIFPNYSKLEAYAKDNGIAYSSRADLIANEKVQAFYTELVAKTMEGKAAYEQVKYFTLLEHGFSPDNGELTLTLKLKRKVINQHYAEAIEKMYQK